MEYNSEYPEKQDTQIEEPQVEDQPVEEELPEQPEVEEAPVEEPKPAPAPPPPPERPADKSPEKEERIDNSPDIPKSKVLKADPDILDKPLIFISAKPNHKVKIPASRIGDKWATHPLYAEFDEKHQFRCSSKYVATILRGQCSVAEILELKG